MIDWSGCAHKKDRAKRMLRGRQDPGMQEAKPNQERRKASLCSGAEDELDPGSSRPGEQRERGLLQSRVSHDCKLETQLLT